MDLNSNYFRNIYNIVYEDENYLLLLLNDNGTKEFDTNLNKISYSIAESFCNGCNAIRGALMNIEETVLLVKICADLSLKDKMFLCLMDKSLNSNMSDQNNYTNGLVSFFLGLSLQSKKQFLINIEKEKNNKFNNLIDILSYVDYNIDNLDNPSYLFMYSTKLSYYSKGYAGLLLKYSIKYLKYLGYNSLFAEATSIKSEKVLCRAGAKVKKSYKFINYPTSSKRYSYLVNKDDRQSHVQFDFKEIL